MRERDVRRRAWPPPGIYAASLCNDGIRTRHDRSGVARSGPVEPDRSEARLRTRASPTALRADPARRSSIARKFLREVLKSLNSRLDLRARRKPRASLTRPASRRFPPPLSRASGKAERSPLLGDPEIARKIRRKLLKTWNPGPDSRIPPAILRRSARRGAFPDWKPCRSSFATAVVRTKRDVAIVHVRYDLGTTFPKTL